MKRVLLASMLSCFLAVSLDAQELKTVRLGSCPLENHQSIDDCQLGYRTFGTLSPARDNAVLVTTWASGTSAQWAPMIGAGDLLDSSRYFVVVVDAFANGVSSSPSNSVRQPHMRFPTFTIHDMVVAQQRFLIEELHLTHLRAVVGQSMGGMQAFEWAVSYPSWMDSVVAVVGSPKLGNYDVLLWQTQLAAVKSDPSWNGGDYSENPAVKVRALLSKLMLTSPEAVNAQVGGGSVTEKEIAATRAVDANNFIRQVEAILSMDVSRQTGGSMERAAQRVKAKMLVIPSRHDQTVTPGAALEFAKMTGATTVMLESPCGHVAPACEIGTVAAAIKDFLR